tara:strand:+ start:113 stop:370 length:258 start_codon:yes stop_codon:yes gene_type:complete
MEKFEFTKKEMNILKKALQDLLEIGITEPQENYIRNIDAGLSKEEAEKIYIKENSKYWLKMVNKEKKSIYVLYNRMFRTPASDNE